jgi:hypothetical protein
VDPALRQILVDRDEAAFERIYYEDKCQHLFSVDWKQGDDEIVQFCADCLDLPSLSGEWRDGQLFILLAGHERRVPLVEDIEDRHITICTLNDMLSPKFEIRYIVASGGSDTAGFAALSCADWQLLESECPEVVAENFIDPRKLPNLFTEFTEANLPVPARARYKRMFNRNTCQPPPAVTKPVVTKPWWKFWASG